MQVSVFFLYIAKIEKIQSSIDSIFKKQDKACHELKEFSQTLFRELLFEK